MRILAFVAFLVSAGSAWAQEGGEIIGVRERVWIAILGGDVEADGDFEGTRIDLEETFDFDARVFNDLNAWLNLPLIVIDRVNVGYWFGSFRESGRIEETFTFDDQTFTAGADLRGEFELSAFSASIEKFIIPLGTNLLGAALSIEAGFKYFDVDLELRSDDLGIREARGFEGLLPVLGARFIGQFTEWVRVEAEIIGVGGQYGDIEGYFVELVAEIAFQPVEFVLLGLGYKLVALNLEADDGDDSFELDLRLGGLFFMVGVKF